jgi:hypothetical protein
MKTIYQRLKPDIKIKLNKSARKYNTAKRLKYTLMSYVSWQSLSIDNITEFFIYTDQYAFEYSGTDIIFGSTFLTPDKK